MIISDKEKAIIEWEAIVDMIDALKSLIDLKRKDEISEIEDIYSYLVWASGKAYAHRKALRNDNH